MVYDCPKPRYSEQMENGVLCFVAQGNTHGKRYGIESGVESKPLTIITRATKNNTQNHIVILVIYLQMDARILTPSVNCVGLTPMLSRPLYDILDINGRLGGFVNISLPPFQNTRHEIQAIKKGNKYYSWIRVVN